jgi:hypothetical protein
MRPRQVLGIDSAKNVFHIHGITATGSVGLRKQRSRQTLLSFLIVCKTASSSFCAPQEDTVYVFSPPTSPRWGRQRSPSTLL